MNNINNDFTRIGRNIKELGSLLSKKIDEKQIPTVFSRNTEIHSSFFHCIGEALSKDEEAAQKIVAQWAEKIIQILTHSGGQVHSSFFLGHLYKKAILDCFEEDIIHHPIPSNHLIGMIKKVDALIYYASTFFTTHSQKLLENDLNNFNQDTLEKRITLQELKDLKKALNEATILAITDKNDNITYANDKFCQITKYPLPELIGKNHRDLLNSGFHDKAFLDEILIAIREGRVWKGEIRNKAKDGSYFWVDTTIVPFLNNNGETYQHISIQHDITEQKEAQDMLYKTEKLAMVGELAAGIAHEIRNPLTTIRGFIQILDHFSEENKYLYSKTILNEIDRINFIISEFMVFAKPHASYFCECNIIEIIKKVHNLLSPEAFLKNIDISLNISQNDIFIYGEKNQLTQVFLNMIKNSIEALPNGGDIEISIITKDNQVVISIKDNGIGMTHEQLDKLGEPFYTTKDTGNGLGLMVSYKIIENHKGKINVESAPFKGTTFHINFPFVNKNE
ncbi:ATP-binding protein [Heyndrickxia sporothermodurans]